FKKLTELQAFLTERNIFTTPWGKKGIENIRNLKLYNHKTTNQSETKFKEKAREPKPKQLSPEQKYFQKKQELEKQVNHHPQKENLNICYIYKNEQPTFRQVPDITNEIIVHHLENACRRYQRNYTELLVCDLQFKAQKLAVRGILAKVLQKFTEYSTYTLEQLKEKDQHFYYIIDKKKKKLVIEKIRKIKEEMNLPVNVELAPHTLRRCFATYNAISGMPLPVLQK
ncbi:1558_t:CDS:2, partial [Ambispora gerdemannii]